MEKNPLEKVKHFSCLGNPSPLGSHNSSIQPRFRLSLLSHVAQANALWQHATMASHPSCDRWCLAMHEQGRADHEQQTRRDELDEMPRCTCLKDRVAGQLRVSGPRTSRASSWMRQKFPLFLHLATSSCRVFCSSSGVLLKSAGGTFDSRQRRFDESNPQFSSMVKPCKKTHAGGISPG